MNDMELEEEDIQEAPEPGSLPAWLRPTRRRRRPAFRYLIDGRFFRRLVAHRGEAALAGFRDSIARHGLGRGEGLPALELTPMAFLETVGIEPPHVDAFPLSQEAIKSGESLKATTFVVKHVETRIRKSPEMRGSFIKKKVGELKTGVDPAAHDLFDLCITRVVSKPGFEDQLIRQLAFDHLYRYPFPDVLRETIFDFLCASLFGTEDSVAGFSKMRMMKTLWDRAYPRLLKANPGERGEIQALDREMKPRTRRDFLAWELIHYSVLGAAAERRFRPVVAFLQDSPERIRSWCIAYKSALRSFLDQISGSDLATLRPNLEAWKPGLLVACGEDGTFGTPVPTSDLPVFGGEKKAQPLERPGAESAPETEGAEAGVRATDG
ncbi:MAG TPA: hypothetical protein VF173_26875 [Thermoanaerobaculia bacterium]|nr:hypothetical protein [Thermoanaerobaculia bacterium]